MPRQTVETSVSTRRSSRLNGSKSDVERTRNHSASSGRRQTKPKASTTKPYDKLGGSRSAGATQPEPSILNPHLGLRRSRRITPEELIRREAALLAREKDLEHQSQEMNQVIGSLKQKEEEMVSSLADREAQATLSQLEQSFLCPLCYDVLSAPHTLNAPNCGHTFCGLCILKWFFSRLHICGAWHESVDCPMCRAMIIPPDRIPRSESSFPFIPNRLATTTISGLTDKLSTRPANTAMMVKREESDDILVSGSKRSRGRNCSRAAPTKTEEGEASQTPDIDGWREGGVLRNEWLKKERMGKHEMTKLLQSWRTLQHNDFTSLKHRLGV